MEQSLAESSSPTAPTTRTRLVFVATAWEMVNVVMAPVSELELLESSAISSGGNTPTSLQGPVLVFPPVNCSLKSFAPAARSAPAMPRFMRSRNTSRTTAPVVDVLSAASVDVQRFCPP